MPTLRPRKRASASSSSALEILARHGDRAGVGALETGHHHQQRRFARAGGTDQADRLAAAYIQVDVFEDMNAGRSLPEREIDAGKLYSDRGDGRAARDDAFMGSTVHGPAHMGQNSAGSSALRRLSWSRLFACGGAGRGRWTGENRGAGQFAHRRLRPAGQSAFPARLAPALKAKGIEVTVVNAGVSGDTASGGLGRLDWSVPEGTEAVILELGANDALRGIDPKLTKAALDAILSKLNARHISVLLAGMQAPPNLGADFASAFDAIYPALASTYAVVFYPFFLDGIVADPKLNQGDGMHPTAAGVDVIVDRMLPSVEGLISRARAARGR